MYISILPNIYTNIIINKVKNINIVSINYIITKHIMMYYE